MKFIVSNQTEPYWNIAVENYLVEHADEVTLYLWKNRRTVVIGQNQNPYSEVNVEALEVDGGYLMRRKTGGGAVYHDDGNINFSFVVPKSLYDQKRQFSVIQRAVESFGLHTELSGRNDILVGTPSDISPTSDLRPLTSDLSPTSDLRPPTSDHSPTSELRTPNSELRKFSGNAFSKGRVNDLHHGTLLIKGNMDDLQRYLRPKPAKLQKHGVASVRSRVVNLSELNPDITAESIVPRLRDAFVAEYSEFADHFEYSEFSEIIKNPEVKALHDHFASVEWKYGNWRTFTAQRCGQFDWGGVEVSLAIEGGIIRDVQIATDALDLAAVEEARRLLVGAPSTTPPRTDNAILKDMVSLLY